MTDPTVPNAGNPDDDIAGILSRWEYSGDGPQARYLEGIGGTRRIQVRLEAGLLQFEIEGRPDGRRPQGHECWWDSFKEHSQRLTENEVGLLRNEIHLYHQRAAVHLLLDNFAGVISDCDRNLLAIAFVCARSRRSDEWLSFESIRAAAVLLRTRAEASMCVRTGDTRGALAAIDRALVLLHSSAAGGSRPDAEEPIEAAALRSMRDVLVPKLPSSQRVDLESRLKQALRMENYELAAILRNELRQIGY